jgi:hypothetical protein
VAARLKVFVTSDGLTDYVVAVSSRAKALAAWGMRQDVFKEGQAHETDEPALVKAALAQPGEVLRRPSGSRAGLAKLKPAKTAKPKGPTAAQRRKVEDLEARLSALDAGLDRDLAAIEGEREALDRKAAASKDRHGAQRAKLSASLARAREALD